MPPRKVKDEQSPMKYITRSSNKNPLKKIKLEKTQTQTIDKNEINYVKSFF